MARITLTFAPARSVTRTLLPLFALALVLALPAGGLAALRSFDGLYGQDAYAYFDYGTVSVRQSILHLAPLEAFFWPPGYPVLVALASFVTGPAALAGQLVSIVLGALVPVFTALLVREIWPDDGRLAVLAGACVAVCGQLWQSSIVVMADTTGLALATLSACALVRYGRTQQPVWLIVASAALAYATLARWIYGLVGIPFAAYALWSLPPARGRAARHAVAAVAVAAVLLVPVLGPSLLGLLSHPSAPATFAGNLQVYSWAPINALRREFFTADGHLEYPLPNGVYYAIAPANLAFFGPLVAVWVPVGLWAALREWQRPTLLLVVGWAGIVYAFHAGAAWQNFRFTLAYLPPLAMLVAAGLAWTWRRVDRRLGLAVALIAAVGLLISVRSSVRLVDGFIDRKNDDLALVRWVETQTPAAAQLLSFGPTLTFRHYTSLPTLDLFDLTPTDLNSVLATHTHTFVVVDEQNIEDQWLGRAPADNLEHLRADPGLVKLGAWGSYTLFQVNLP
ncbi:MAG: glycosyltransferase family 39 protein [Chloroflexi bacterium]|nr:glycosyltransferase family 39 protein [Chloroflexota bacterium]